MKKKLTFKEYYDSKEQLKEALKLSPRTKVEYLIKKYCKVPILVENDGQLVKDFVGLKPKDKIKILWEYGNLENPVPKLIIVNEKNYLPFWNEKKIKEWIKDTTLKVK